MFAIMVHYLKPKNGNSLSLLLEVIKCQDLATHLSRLISFKIKLKPWNKK